MPLRFAFRSLLSPLPFLVFLAILQIFITPTGDSYVFFQWRFLHASIAGLLAAIKVLTRFMALILGLSLTSYTISSSELITGLRGLLRPLGKIGIPVNDLILMIQVTLRFIPLLALSAERIAKAQASRGAEWGTGHGNLVQRAREVIPLIVPLFLTTLRRAENLALAMDARGYGSSAAPTSMTILKTTSRDTIAVATALIAAVLIVIVP
jgi:energy-coupling factor transport system permease protein